MKKLAGMMLGAAMALSLAGTAFAGAWQSDVNGYWYQRDDGSWPEAAWEYIDGQWNVFDVHGYWIDPDKLAVHILPNTCIDGGDCWIVMADYQVPIPVPGDLSNGALCTIVNNAVTGQSENMIIFNDYLFPLNASSYDDIYQAKYYVDNGRVWDAFGSDDIAYWTVYSGPLYIRKSVTTVSAPVANISLPFDPTEEDWLNKITFDAGGYVDSLTFLGD